MRRQHRILMAVLCLAAAASCQNVTPSNPFDPDTPSGDKAAAVLSGSVTAEAAAAALITVTLPELGISRTPEPDGSFEIRDIQAGSHLIEVQADGHASYRDSRYFPVGGTVVLELSLAAHRGACTDPARPRLAPTAPRRPLTLTNASPPIPEVDGTSHPAGEGGCIPGLAAGRGP